MYLQGLFGARKRKQLHISKISSNNTNQHEPTQHSYDEEDLSFRKESKQEPNSNAIHAILGELKLAKQRSIKMKELDVRDEADGGFMQGHSEGGPLVQDNKMSNRFWTPAAPPLLMMPPAHAHAQTNVVHSTTLPATSTDTVLLESVDAADPRKNHDQQRVAFMMTMMGCHGRDKCFSYSKHPLPNPPPSPPTTAQMDITASSKLPRVTKSQYTDKLYMAGEKHYRAVTPLYHGLEFAHVSSSFGRPPSSTGSTHGCGIDDGVKVIRKYQKRVKVEEGCMRNSTGGGSDSGDSSYIGVTPPEVKPKQLRYRTEKPFHCPHCPVSFTLRSNMERHGKSLHTAVWKRSPSIRVLNKQRALQAQQSAQGIQALSSMDNTSPPQDLSSREWYWQNNIRLVLSQHLKMKLSNLETRDSASAETLIEKTGNENFKRYFRIGGDFDDEEGKTKDLSVGNEKEGALDNDGELENDKSDELREDFQDEAEDGDHHDTPGENLAGAVL